MKPLRFRPYYKPVIWGGNRIGTYKGETMPAERIGESWEISGYPSQLSVVIDGEYTGLNINEVIKREGASFVGRHIYERYGNTFPLILKILDAHADLSVQVHPDDVAAASYGDAMGKTEMWYTLDVLPGAKIYAGFSRDTTADEVSDRVNNCTLSDIVNSHDNHQGAVYYLPSGQLHAIGAGNLLLEVQQASDRTFRLYDYGRRDGDGNLRQLHLDDAFAVMSFKANRSLKLAEPDIIEDSQRLLCSCDYFSISEIDVLDEASWHNTHDSFAMVFCVRGTVDVTDSDGYTERIRQGHTILYPASSDRLTMTGKGKLLIITA